MMEHFVRDQMTVCYMVEHIALITGTVVALVMLFLRFTTSCVYK